MLQEFDRENFIGFWHPFGAHGNEAREAILRRKESEIKNNGGWTLWSFQHRTDETLRRWLRELENKKRVFVFCSDSKGAVDPRGNIARAAKFKDPFSDDWQPIPSAISIPHPFGNKKYGSAFKVSAVHSAESIGASQIKNIQWLFKKNIWRNDKLPTRGEFLVKSRGTSNLRPVYAVLELKRPYVVTISS